MNDLKEIILYKVGKSSEENLTNEDIQAVTELNLNNRAFDGEDKNIDLTQLKILQHIQRLSLQYFKIDDEIINIIKQLKKLEELQLISCEINIKNELSINSLSKLTLNTCKIKDYSRIRVPKTFTIIGNGKVHLEKVEGLEQLEVINILNSDIKGLASILKCKQLKILNLDGSTFKDKDVLNEIRRSGVEISLRQEYLPIK